MRPRRVQFHGRYRDDRCRGNQFFSARHGRWRRDNRVRHFVRGNAGRCIRRESRLPDRVRWVLVRERGWRRRDQRVQEPDQVVQRGDRDRGMYREA